MLGTSNQIRNPAPSHDYIRNTNVMIIFKFLCSEHENSIIILISIYYINNILSLIQWHMFQTFLFYFIYFKAFSFSLFNFKSLCFKRFIFSSLVSAVTIPFFLIYLLCKKISLQCQQLQLRFPFSSLSLSWNYVSTLSTLSFLSLGLSLSSLSFSLPLSITIQKLYCVCCVIYFASSLIFRSSLFLFLIFSSFHPLKGLLCSIFFSLWFLYCFWQKKVWPLSFLFLFFV